MKQTPAHTLHNPDLLKMIPPDSRKIIEVGCSSGALAREFKLTHPDAHWVGIEIDAAYAALASAHCDEALTMNIDDCDSHFYRLYADRDCWVFGDTLEHLKDPWTVLKAIRSVISHDACIVACIPNFQHWSVIARLSVGDFRYADSGLLDRTHLRFFTRQTIIELFRDAGFIIAAGHPRIFNEPGRDKFIKIIQDLAQIAGADPKLVANDLTPLQFVIRAIPN